jgi:hypothetical protein
VEFKPAAKNRMLCPLIVIFLLYVMCWSCCITGDTTCLSDDKVNLEQETDELKDYRFTKWMSKNVKLQGIPPSAFYSEPHKHLVETSVRYCFIKV